MCALAKRMHCTHQFVFRHNFFNYSFGFTFFHNGRRPIFPTFGDVKLTTTKFGQNFSNALRCRFGFERCIYGLSYVYIKIEFNMWLAALSENELNWGDWARQMWALVCLWRIDDRAFLDQNEPFRHMCVRERNIYLFLSIGTDCNALRAQTENIEN